MTENIINVIVLQDELPIIRLQLKLPLKLKLKDTTYKKTYGPQSWVNTWK